MSSYCMLMAVLFLTSMSMVHGEQPFNEAIREAFYGVFKNQPPSARRIVGERGVVKSCGPSDANFTVEWDPKVIDPEGHIVVYYNYTIPHDFNSGTAYVALYFNKIPNPIFEDTFPIGCDKLRKYIPCPLHRGLKLQGKYPYSNLLILKGYDGTYRGVIRLSNENNDVMFCANATVTIQGKE